MYQCKRCDYPVWVVFGLHEFDGEYILAIMVQNDKGQYVSVNFCPECGAKLKDRSDLKFIEQLPETHALAV